MTATDITPAKASCILNLDLDFLANDSLNLLIKVVQIKLNDFDNRISESNTLD